MYCRKNLQCAISWIGLKLVKHCIVLALVSLISQELWTYIFKIKGNPFIMYWNLKKAWASHFEILTRCSHWHTDLLQWQDHTIIGIDCAQIWACSHFVIGLKMTGRVRVLINFDNFYLPSQQPTAKPISHVWEPKEVNSAVGCFSYFSSHWQDLIYEKKCWQKDILSGGLYCAPQGSLLGF